MTNTAPEPPVPVAFFSDLMGIEALKYALILSAVVCIFWHTAPTCQQHCKVALVGVVDAVFLYTVVWSSARWGVERPMVVRCLRQPSSGPDKHQIKTHDHVNVVHLKLSLLHVDTYVGLFYRTRERKNSHRTQLLFHDFWLPLKY